MSALNRLFELLKTSVVELEGSSIKFALPESISSAQMKQLLAESGYIVDEVKTVRSSTVLIKLTAPSWSHGLPIIKNFSDLFSQVVRSGGIPNNYYILDSKKAKSDADEEAVLLKLYLQTRSLLAELTDHCDPQDGVVKGRENLLYFIKCDNDVKKYEFRPDITWSDLSALDNPVDKYNIVEELLRYITVGDMQDVERRAVMRSALGEQLSKISLASQSFIMLIQNLAAFKSKYVEHHDLFVRRFSVNKVLKEISDHDLQYTSKINEIISSAQGKALTIPAALVAISAVMNIKSAAEGVAIFIGLFLSVVVVWISLKVHRDTFTHIQNQISEVFEKYESFDVGNDIGVAAGRVKQTLNVLVSNALSNIYLVRKIVIVAFICSSLFILYGAMNISSINPIACQKIDIEITRDESVIVIGDRLNLRSAPHRLSDIKHRLKAGAVLGVIDDSHSDWLKVSVERSSLQGWVSKQYIRPIASSDIEGRVSICK